MILTSEQQEIIENANVTKLAKLMKKDWYILDGCKTELNILCNEVTYGESDITRISEKLSKLIKIAMALGKANEY